MSLTVQEFVRELQSGTRFPPDVLAELEQALTNPQSTDHAHAATAVHHTIGEGLSDAAADQEIWFVANCRPLAVIARDDCGVTFSAVCRHDREPAVLRILFPAQPTRARQSQAGDMNAKSSAPSTTKPDNARLTNGHASVVPATVCADEETSERCWQPSPDMRCVPVRAWQESCGFSCVMWAETLADPLPDVIATAGPLPVEAALEITRELAESLRQAHESGYGHGRLAVANCLLDDDGQLWLQLDQPFRRQPMHPNALATRLNRSDQADVARDIEIVREVLCVSLGVGAASATIAPQSLRSAGPPENTSTENGTTDRGLAFYTSAELWSQCQDINDVLLLLKSAAAGTVPAFAHEQHESRIASTLVDPAAAEETDADLEALRTTTMEFSLSEISSQLAGQKVPEPSATLEAEARQTTDDSDGSDNSAEASQPTARLLGEEDLIEVSQISREIVVPSASRTVLSENAVMADEEARTSAEVAGLESTVEMTRSQILGESAPPRSQVKKTPESGISSLTTIGVLAVTALLIFVFVIYLLVR